MCFFELCLIKLQIFVSVLGIDLFHFFFYICHFQNTPVQLLQAATRSAIRGPHMICLSCNTVTKQYRSDLDAEGRHVHHLVLIFGAAMKARTFIVC